jgi:hypothetical protein
VGLLVVLPNDRKRLHDVVDIITLDAVQMKERGIELGAQKEPAVGIPAGTV